MKQKRPRIVAVDPQGGLVFNCNTQTYYFRSIKAAKRAIQEDLEEPVAEDLDEKREITFGEDSEWELKDYRFFQEIL